MNDGIKWCGFPLDEVFWPAVVRTVQMFPVSMKDAGKKAKREKWGKENYEHGEEEEEKRRRGRRERDKTNIRASTKTPLNYSKSACIICLGYFADSS